MASDDIPLWAIVFGILAVLAIVAWVIIPTFNPDPIEIPTFTISPDSFRVGTRSELTIVINNRKKQSVDVSIYLETQLNVNISSSAGLLSRTGANFTIQKHMAPEDGSITVVLYVTGIIEVGDASRDYVIKGYFLASGLKAPITKEVEFTVTRN